MLSLLLSANWEKLKNPKASHPRENINISNVTHSFVIFFSVTPWTGNQVTAVSEWCWVRVVKSSVLWRWIPCLLLDREVSSFYEWREAQTKRQYKTCRYIPLLIRSTIARVEFQSIALNVVYFQSAEPGRSLTAWIKHLQEFFSTRWRNNWGVLQSLSRKKLHVAVSATRNRINKHNNFLVALFLSL